MSVVGGIEVVQASVGAVQPLSSIVVIGDRFDLSMFDPNLFGAPDPGQQLIVGPLAQFSYMKGLCSFSLLPNRIDVRMVDREILPNTIIEAAKVVLNRIDDLRGAVLVTEIGINYDAPFDMEGTAFCQELVKSSKVKNLLSETPMTTNLSFRFVRAGFRYMVRIEPEVASNGKRLFVGVNGSRTIAQGAPSSPTLGHAGAFRRYVEGVHERVQQ